MFWLLLLIFSLYRYNNNNNNNDDDDDDDNNNNNITAFKGAIRDFFYNLLIAPRTVSNAYAQVALAQSCENHLHRVLITCNMSCYMPRGTKGQLSYEV